ncbi:hypothetical protein FB45DRAFT_760127 [Roridomyces roridus]|uniref:F-box domain-containing protein n=1 Tax=Roridomyces roridus TaxID=1738132 RepID=A0AAD7B6U7_9AGAR|nr:hypothetical protein FB45DRAFT_760127 [Roridomyces roridus]
MPLTITIIAGVESGFSGLEPPPYLQAVTSCKNSPFAEPEALTARRWLVAAERELAHQNQSQGKETSSLTSLVGLYRVALAPHKRLPNEILREIFLVVCTNDHRTDDEPGLEISLNRILFPEHNRPLNMHITLSHVSSHWRTLALGTPELWTTLQVDFGVPTPSITRLLNLLDTFISRGGEMPLAFEITQMADDPRIVQLLTHHAKRIRNLAADGAGLLGAFFDLAPGSMECLETLRWDDDEFMPARLCPITVLADAPRLRCLQLTMGMDMMQLQNLPWHQLDELELGVESSPGNSLVDVYYVLAIDAHRSELPGSVFPAWTRWRSETGSGSSSARVSKHCSSCRFPSMNLGYSSSRSLYLRSSSCN